MYKKTFNTIKKNPIILLGFALPILLSIAAVIPILSGITPLINDVMAAESAGTQVNDMVIFDFFSKYMLTFALIMLISGLSIFLIMPPILNKIYDACSGNNEPNWYARGLKRSWWKIFVTSIIMSTISSMLGFVVVLIMFIPIAGMFAYSVVILGLSVIVIIAHTSVIAEDDYGTGLSNIFSIGFKYFFKQLGAFALINIPTFVLSIAMSVTMGIQVFQLSYSSAIDVEIVSFFNTFMPIMYVFIGVISLYSVFSTSFTYVFSMHSYLDKKSQLSSTEQSAA